MWLLGAGDKTSWCYDNGLCLPLPELAVCMCLLGLHGRQIHMKDVSTFRVHCVNISGLFFFLLSFFSYSDSDDKNQRAHSGELGSHAWRVTCLYILLVWSPLIHVYLIVAL